MREIVERLTENRQIEVAKSILESNGYKVTKRSRRLKESTSSILSEIESCEDCWTLDNYVDMMYSELEEYEGVVSFVSKCLDKDPAQIRVASQQSDFDTSDLVYTAMSEVESRGKSFTCNLDYYGSEESFNYNCSTLGGQKVVIGTELDDYAVIFF